MRLLTLLVFALIPTRAPAEQQISYDTDATIDVGRISTCLRRPHDDPRHCIGIEAAACHDRPSDAPNPSVAAMRCAYAEMNFWQSLMDTNQTILTQNLHGASLKAFEDQQFQWQHSTLCGFPFDVLDAPLWPQAPATDCELLRLAERAIQVKGYVTDYLDDCEYPASDVAPGFQCKP